MSFFRIFQFWHLITRKRKQQSNFWDIWGCSARQDLSAVRIPCWSMKRCWSYCPFKAVFSNFSTLAFNISESIIAREVIQIGLCSFWCAEHNWAMKFYFRAAIFFKMAATISKNVNFVWFQWKLISRGNLMTRILWYYLILFPTSHFQNGRHIAKL